MQTKIFYVSIIIVLSTYNLVVAQNPGTTLYVEEFNSSSIPAYWETTNDATSAGTHDWIFGVTDMPTGADFTNNAAIFDDFAAGDTGLHDRRHLQMNHPIDISNYENVRIGYEYALQVNAGAGKLVVLIGYPAHWYIFQNYTTSSDPTYVEFELEDFISNHSIPRDNLHIGFIYDDENSGQNWGAGIGVVKLFGYPVTPAVNDYCENAIDATPDLLSSSHHYSDSKDTNGANQFLGDNPEDGICGTDEPDGVWYKFTPTTNGDLNIIGDPYYWDCELLVYSGSCDDFTCVEGADEVGFNTEENFSVTLSANTDYYINIGRWSNILENYGGLLYTQMIWTPNATDVEDTSIEGFQMYPNPSENTVFFSAKNSIKSIVIRNMLGQKVLATYPNSDSFQYDISHLTAGYYFISIQAGEQYGTYKLLKK